MRGIWVIGLLAVFSLVGSACMSAPPPTDGNAPDGGEDACTVPGDFMQIQEAVSATRCNVVELAPGVYMENLSLDREVEIRRSGDGQVRIIGDAREGSVIGVSRGPVFLTGIEITGGAAVEGGGVYSEADLNLTDCIIEGNLATEGGAGIAVIGARLTMLRTQVLMNSLASSTSGNPAGAGIMISNGAIEAKSSTVSGNTIRLTELGSQAGFGAGIFVENGEAKLSSMMVSKNRIQAEVQGSQTSTLLARGGGIFTLDSSLSLEGSSVSENIVESTLEETTAEGAGIYSEEGSVRIENSLITNQRISLRTGDSRASSQVSGCGAAFKNTSSLHVASSRIELNSITASGQRAFTRGAGVFLSEAVSGNIESSVFSQNQVSLESSTSTEFAGGGAGLWVDRSVVSLRDVSIERNSVSSVGMNITGAGLYVRGSPLGATNVSRTTISDNVLSTAGLGEGGGAVFVGVVAALANSTVSGNRILGAGTGTGGGIVVRGASDGVSRLELSSVTLAMNTVSSSTGSAGALSIQQEQGQQATGAVIRNTLIADNSSPDQQGCNGLQPTSDGYNFFGDTCLAGGDTASNIEGDPLLEPLALNTGQTATHALRAGSPAIDAGNPQGCVSSSGVLLEEDQTGSSRVHGGRCDIGAYEFR